MLHNLFQIFLRIKRILTSPVFVRDSDMIKRKKKRCTLRETYFSRANDDWYHQVFGIIGNVLLHICVIDFVAVGGVLRC